MENNRGLTIKDILIRLILIIIFIFLLIWLFPMPDLKPLNNQIFADNIDRMKEVAKSYYTLERLPKNINDSKKMTLKEMIDNKLILPLMDSNGKYCSEDDSYVEITKLENEYIIKVNLSCTDKQDYIIEHYGCYDICSDTCKNLETTSKSGYAKDITTNYKTTKSSSKIYEYQFTKNECTQNFDKYVCPSGYYLVGDTCIKNDSKVVTNPADEKITNVTSTDTKEADIIEDSSTEVKPAECKNEETTVTSTIDAGYKKTTYSATEVTTTQKVKANETYSYDVKGAVETSKKITASYNIINNYDIVDADKTYSSYEWQYVSTKVTTEAGLEFVGEDEKLIAAGSWQERECAACAAVVTYYRYFRYKKVVTGTPTYSCDSHPGYTLYDGNKCRKSTGSTKKCPSGYDDTGSECVKYDKFLSCSKYGSDYKLNDSNKTCVKTTTSYNCNGIGETTSDPKYCSKVTKEYTCPSYMEKQGTGSSTVCIDKHDYYCPSNTENKTYTLNGTKCTVQTKKTVKVCSCDKYPGSVQSEDKESCIIKNSSTKYSCDKYPDYTLTGDKCVKTTTTQELTYSCDRYPGSTLNGMYCVKTESTTDTKKADKYYTTSCNQKYKWSTNTFLEGWTYTGNKREIN